MATKWNQEQTAALISLYEQRPVLYNAKHALYHNRTAREEPLKEISNALEEQRPWTTTQDIKLKIKTLRTQYGLERINVMESEQQNGGANSDEVYTPKLWCFDMLNFLETSVQNLGKGKRKSEGPLAENRPKEKRAQRQSHSNGNEIANYNFAKFICDELANFSNRAILEDTKWSIQLAIRKGLEKDRTARGGADMRTPDGSQSPTPSEAGSLHVVDVKMESGSPVWESPTYQPEEFDVNF